MFIVEREFVPPKTSIEFEITLPKDAVIKSAYQRDGKFFVLFTCQKAIADDERIQRKFQVLWLRNSESIGTTIFTAVGAIRYAGGDRFASPAQPGGAEVTVHFFEVLEEEES
jgi:hypothetical protein